MAAWQETLHEISEAGSAYDIIRRKRLADLRRHTGRNAILYYSGWLQKPHLARSSGALVGISDADKNGFMSVIHKLDRKKGLDLFLHTPGGDMAATESLIDYIRMMFGNDVRAIIPQLPCPAGQ